MITERGIHVMPVAEHEAVLHSVSVVAARCRWENLGYRDGQPGTIQDIEDRLAGYEECVRLYMRSEQTLKERIKVLEESS